jgi:hypothetical protein
VQRQVRSTAPANQLCILLRQIGLLFSSEALERLTVCLCVEELAGGLCCLLGVVEVRRLCRISATVCQNDRAPKAAPLPWDPLICDPDLIVQTP